VLAVTATEFVEQQKPGVKIINFTCPKCCVPAENTSESSPPTKTTRRGRKRVRESPPKPMPPKLSTKEAAVALDPVTVAEARNCGAQIAREVFT
jgi:hypothetical protein